MNAAGFVLRIDLPLAVLIVGLAEAMRLRAVGTAIDLSSDEVNYIDLGVSLRHGVFPPKFEGAPFLLHPPLFFALSAVWEDVLRPGSTYIDLAVRVRELNVLCAALSAGLIFYIGSRLAGRVAGVAAGLLFTFDPFLQQINGQVLLETSTWMFILAGWAILLHLFHDGLRRPLTTAIVGGLVLGLSLVAKDMALAVTVPPLLVALWRRWASRKLLGIATLFSLVPFAIYLCAVSATDHIALWAAEETSGVQRILGIQKTTGYSVGGHPSLLFTLLRESNLYGLSYAVCGLGVLSGVYLLRRSPVNEIRVVATMTMTGALTLAYATFFGTIEEPFFYFPAVPALIMLPVAVVVFFRSRSPERSRLAPRAAFALLVLVLVYNGAVWVHVRSTPDNGVQRLVTWFQRLGRPPGIIACDTSVAAYVLQRSGFNAIAAAPLAQAQAAHVSYVTIMSVTVQGHYGTLTPSAAAWYRRHGTLVYRFDEPSYGVISIYRPKNPALW